MHKGFVFDYAIVHDIKNQATAYQTMARVFGNIGGFNERPCAIYAAETTFALIKKAEDTAVYLANLVHTEGLKTVCMEDLERAAATEEEAKWVLHQTECATLAEAEALVGTYGIKLKSRQSQDPCINRLLSDELMSYDDLTRRLTSMRKMAYMGCNRPVKDRAMQGAHIFVGYRDLEDATTAVFIVRAIGKKVRKLVRKEVVEEPKKKRKLIRK
jgi:hypothetical protein